MQKRGTGHSLAFSMSTWWSLELLNTARRRSAVYRTPTWFFVFVQCRELEVDLDNETRRGSEIQKNAKKMERRLKDVCQQQEEDQKNLQHAKDQIDRLNKKCKTTKANQDEAVS